MLNNHSFRDLLFFNQDYLNDLREIYTPGIHVPGAIIKDLKSLVDFANVLPAVLGLPAFGGDYQY